ncbi:DUF5819 family protein [Belliella kenyensis]|uniref:DUF5819 family protein n=1 Tax=Belliella kenyensis TaxID=1472724 RepID=A0ABV8ERH3_9BACT|nr:DUF5819 family protein [Belliella kenyensis]MCH7402286.1 DUF5819 family protein [Belliella kenyensis]MDN3601803.1 DUF5819 family protein [Belliella kenyensis]
MKIIKIILITILTVHFTIIGVHHLPNNPIKHQFKYEITSYIIPFYSQEWKLFAPNPVNKNMSILYRFSGYSKADTLFLSDWLSTTDKLIEDRQRNFWSPSQRILKYLSSCHIDIMETYSKGIEFIDKSDSLKSDINKSETFLKELMKSSSGHNSVLTYSKFVYNNYALDNSFENVDSVLVEYKILESSFPRFSNRNLDYYDLNNYEFKELLSSPYKIFPE